MLYLSYGVYRSSFVFNNIFHLIKRHTQNTRKCTQYTRKKVSLEPLSKSNITICDAGMFSNKIIFRLTPNNQKE